MKIIKIITVFVTIMGNGFYVSSCKNKNESEEHNLTQPRIDNLPWELKIKILGKIDLKSVIKFSMTSKQNRSLILKELDHINITDPFCSYSKYVGVVAHHGKDARMRKNRRDAENQNKIIFTKLKNSILDSIDKLESVKSININCMPNEKSDFNMFDERHLEIVSDLFEKIHNLETVRFLYLLIPSIGHSFGLDILNKINGSSSINRLEMITPLFKQTFGNHNYNYNQYISAQEFLDGFPKNPQNRFEEHTKHAKDVLEIINNLKSKLGDNFKLIE